MWAGSGVGQALWRCGAPLGTDHRISATAACPSFLGVAFGLRGGSRRFEADQRPRRAIGIEERHVAKLGTMAKVGVHRYISATVVGRSSIKARRCA